jgi:signal transduction histidine kinase
MEIEIEKLLKQSKEFRDARNVDGLKIAEKAYNLATKTNNTELQIRAFRELMGFHYSITSNYAEAERLCNEFREFVTPEKHPEVCAQIANILGICNDVAGNYFESRNYYLQTIEWLEGRKDLSKEGMGSLANAYYNLSKLYQHIEVADERFDYLDKAKKIFEDLEDNDGLARVWNLKAAMLSEDTGIEERLSVFAKALGYYKHSKDVTGHALCLANVGLCYVHLGRFDDGLERMLAALDIIRKSNSAPLVGFTLFQIGEAYRIKGDHQSALKFLQEAEEVLVKGNAKVFLNVVYHEWATNLAAVGNYREAYDKALKYIEQITDRMRFDRQSVEAQARMKFELAKKQRESEILRKKNEEIELFNERLQQSNAELNQFAYVASHDLKEPLRMVSNYMQLLEKSFDKNALSDDQRDYMRYASEGAKRMYSLIDSLLVFSRATADTTYTKIDLNDVLDVVKRTIVSSNSKPVNIDAEQLPHVMADYNQMVQLFQNIIGNSVKYNDKETVAIKITCALENKMHHITISDNGIGIENKHREKVFELFKRLHHKEVYSGTGIGLSICKKIIQQMNGKIWIEDSELGGTAFVFTLPQMEED